ncbi:MAG: LysR family transcriptional regulator [Rhodoferax sp.]|uniref:LysR family transcriptional regulator n=1 Tax=Rhodoferax sp. TaxID=50421 RepID=UPI0014014D3B|nr:LysR family transcriptional regulator [Rhodoferax sp.]NDP38101.1 LysR family transcriptional regulator [Rhodoferax sp.]
MTDHDQDHDAARRTRTKLKTRQMFLLLALDEARNLHQAAKETHMSQPAASKMLKDIEELFGVPFFERLPRGVRPTLYGETMIRHVRMALTNLSQGQDAIATLQAGLSGQVDIGVIITPATTLVPQAIARTKQEAPRLCIGVEVGTSTELVGRLKHGQLDFLIARIREQEDDLDLLYEDLSEEAECAVARVGHPLLAHSDLSLNDLAAASWILSPRGSILRHQFDMMFRRIDLETPANVVETTAISVITSLLQQTDFLHVMPLEVAHYYVRSGELAILPIDLPCKMDSFGIIMRRDQLLSPGANLLLQHVRAIAVGMY